MVRRRIFRRVSLLLGSTLGVAACPVAAEYGMPHASFELDGVVLDEQSGAGVLGIEVGFGGKSAVSRADGSWSLSVEQAFACGPDCTISARDIDGPDNGTYVEEITEFTATQTSQGDESWDGGVWEAHDIEISMKPDEVDSGF